MVIDQPPWTIFLAADESEFVTALQARLTAAPAAAHDDGLPDGGVALVETGDIRAAWYGAPTRRYRHAVLGDDIEAGRLHVRLADGDVLSLDLPEKEVFEDITPRLADLDGDGFTEVVTIRSSTRLGASVAIYGVVDGRLAQRAATPFIGRAHRWLNIAGIADFLGEGGVQIAYVETPHIGGTLYLWSFARGALTRRAALGGFSNHAIGSRVQAMSVTADLYGDGRLELIVPDDRRRNLKVVKADAAGWRICDTIEMPNRIAGLAAADVGLSAPLSGDKTIEDVIPSYVAFDVLFEAGGATVSHPGFIAGETEPQPCL